VQSAGFAMPGSSARKCQIRPDHGADIVHASSRAYLIESCGETHASLAAARRISLLIIQ